MRWAALHLLFAEAIAAPYTELTSVRSPFTGYQPHGHDPPPSWPVSAAATAWQLVPAARGAAMLGHSPGSEQCAIFFASERTAFSKVNTSTGMNAVPTCASGSARLAVSNGNIVALVTAVALFHVSCQLSVGGASKNGCTMQHALDFKFGPVSAVHAAGTDLWVAAANGLYHVDLAPAALKAAPARAAPPELVLAANLTALAYDAPITGV